MTAKKGDTYREKLQGLERGRGPCLGGSQAWLMGNGEGKEGSNVLVLSLPRNPIQESSGCSTAAHFSNSRS